MHSSVGINFSESIGSEERRSSRLDWAESSWTRWIEILLHSWITPILSLSNQRTLAENDLDDVSIHDQCSVLLRRVNQYGSQWPGTWHALRRTFHRDSLISIILVLPLIMVHLAQPLLIRYLVLFIKDQSGLPWYAGYLFGLGLFIASILQAMISQQMFFRNSRLGMRVRNGLSSALYQHLLTTNTAALHGTTAAQMINLVSNDVGKFEELSMFVHTPFLATLEALAAFGLIAWLIGLPTLFGCAVLIALVPIQLIFSRQFSRYRNITMASTDKRVQTIHELVNGCQIIKMYNWEKAMERRVREARRRELSNITNVSWLRAINVAIAFASLPLIALATFGGSWLMDRTLLSEDIFTTIAFFVMVRVPVTIGLPTAIEKFSEARVSARRIDQFMQLARVSDQRPYMEDENEENLIRMEGASFSWSDTPALISLNLKIKRGALIGVKGSIGAGKSTLLAGLLNEINLVSGQLQRNVNSTSYAPQLAWIFPGTIRANILLGKAMDHQRYKNVIKACCLDNDLANFGQTGDLLIIGDRGVNLSGGQKARISLARALYADADVYLLDDPLAAVDPKVAKHIFDQCIGPRSFLRDKTRIFVTHQTNFLVETDQIIIVTDGRINECQMAHLSNVSSEAAALADNKEQDWVPNATMTDNNSIVKEETSVLGAIDWRVWFKLFTAPPLRCFGLSLMIIFMLMNEAVYDFSNVWLALWSNKDKSEQRSSFYAYVYLAAVASTLIIAIIRVSYAYYIMLRGSTYLHNRMLKGMLSTSLRFFESNPTGRILNRASKDQQVLDQLLPFAFIDTMQYLLMIIGSISVIGRTNPWVLLVLIPLLPAVLWLRRFYIHASRQLKRLESVTRSPIYTHFSSSFDGLTSIRAFHVQEDFLNMLMMKIDANSRASFVVSTSAYWFGLRLDFIVSFLTLVTAVLAVAVRHQIDASTAALSVTYCISLTGLFPWAMRQSAEAENFMTSAERIHEYGQLAPEEQQQSNALLESAEDWPSRGRIEFKDYTFRYRPELDPVLTNLNLQIESQEKIGIIGRTGLILSSCGTVLDPCLFSI